MNPRRPRSRTEVDSSALARFDLEVAGEGPVAGIDEAGRGPLAGPVVAAAVIFQPGVVIDGVNDSKRLSPDARDELFDVIHERALAVAVGMADAEEIDTVNILEATRNACRRALDALAVQPASLLFDALTLAGESRPQKAVVGGDGRSQSIAAASIVAKVTRDRLMRRYAPEYPDYGFERHKGYGVARHLEVLSRIGPSTLHRLTFSGVCFFHTVCRRSRTADGLLARLAASLSPAARDRLRSEIDSASGFLPRREIRELRAALARTAR